jgi:phosphatidylserine decarboxylase
MTTKAQILRIFEQEDINFLLTNRIPRRLATQFIGWFSRIEQPLIRDISIGIWRLFSGLDLSEARKSKFRSLHDCFIRELREGARPIDGAADIVISPCDAIVGACGVIAGTELYQAKGFPYTLQDLLCDPSLVEAHRNGRYVTLRLTSSMYHRFHAPHDAHIERVTLIHGDTWNVNPIALKRIEKLFCKNERAVIRTRLKNGDALTLVPVAAILVASIKLHFLDLVLNSQTRGALQFPCNVNVNKGDELGWFEHGSTIIVLAPEHYEFCDHVSEWGRIRAGESLLRNPRA